MESLALTRSSRRYLAVALAIASHLPCVAGLVTPVAPSPEDWRSYLAENTRTHYSALAQIDTANVAKLERAWTFTVARQAGSASGPWRGNPIVISGTLFAATPDGKLIALDAATGSEVWRFDPASLGDPSNPLEEILGVAAWNNGTRLFLYLRSNDFVYAVDALSGTSIDSFGDGGRIDLLPSVDRDIRAPFVVKTAPITVFGSRIFVSVGPALSNSGSGPAGGVRAFDAETGTSLWTSVGPAEASSALAADHSTGHLYLAAQDAVLCLDSADGSRMWQRGFPPGQTAKTPTPVLFTLHLKGRDTPALALTMDSGRVVTLDRGSGEPLTDAAGYTVISPEDANNNAADPAVDPGNRLFLAAGDRALAATHLAAQEMLWRGHPVTAPSGGDPIVTGGNLVFRGSTEGLLALDANTGAVRWTTELESSPTGTPLTYRALGRQFVVVPCGDALVAFALPLELIAKPAAIARSPERFEEEICQIEARLQRDSPTPGGIVFYGSSTFKFWNVEAAFPDLPVTNLGFGGSQISDLNHYAERLLLPLRPRLIVFYSGNNDVNANFSFDEIMMRWRNFSDWIDQHLPETHVLVLSNLPTPRRWALWPDLHVLNARLASEIARHPRRHYLDGTPIMLDADGRLRLDRISADILHLNAIGNAVMAETLRPAIAVIWSKIHRP